MKQLRNVVVAVALGLAVAGLAAAEANPYTDEAFDAAQAEQRPVLIDVYATWCPTCRRQAQILAGLLEEAEFEELLVLKVDWDAQKEIAQRFGAPRQSTLIAFRGTEERGRSVADTRKESIRELLLEAVRD